MVGQTSQLQHIGNEPRQPLALKKNKIVIRLPSCLILHPAGPQHLSIHANGSQGRFEFMADCRDKIATLDRQVDLLQPQTVEAIMPDQEH